MNKKIVFFFYFFALFPILCHSMNKNKEKGSLALKNNPGTDKPFFKFVGNDNYPYTMRTLYRNPEYTRLASEQFVLSQKDIIDDMNKKAAEPNTKVHIKVGAHALNDMTNYNVTTVERDINRHGKITVGLIASPVKKLKKPSPQEGQLFITSCNGTNVWKNNFNSNNPRYNFETGILTNDKELATRAYDMILSQSPVKKQKNTIQVTPKKPELHNSKHTDLNATIAQRLFNLAESKSNNRAAFVRTMNINDEKVVNAAIKAQKSGAKVELLANHTALTKHGMPLLQKLDDAGVDVSIFMPNEHSQTIHHSKAVDIIKGKKRIHLENTGNLTEEGDKQRNYTLLIPDNKEIVKDSIQNFKQVKKFCIPFDEAKKIKVKRDTAKAEKRKAAKELKNQPAAKKSKKVTDL
ncbi:MAG TPA: hypothetical protein VK431_03340 [Nitrosopumilaceae archaeon]|nr:hypothetical protein [Nitrosopumilaceae archaeon]